MSEEHDVSADQLLNALKHVEIPAADEAAKRRAITHAVSEFNLQQQQNIDSRDQHTYQGFWQRFRSSYNGELDRRRERMSFYKRILIAGASSAVAVLLAITVFVQRFNLPDVYRQDEPDMLLSYTDISTDETAEVVSVNKMQREETVTAIPPDLPMARFKPSFSENIMPREAHEHELVAHDRFQSFSANPVKQTRKEPLSTFSIAVDTASYSFVRRQLNQGVLPPKAAVRAEEMINYFDYQYPAPESQQEPFRTTVSVSESPWRQGNKLIHIGIKGYELPAQAKRRSNVVFLIDVSGSMNSADKLTLLKSSLRLLLKKLKADDTVGLVVYAGAAGVVLQPTKVANKYKILDAIEHLQAGGSTAGGEGLRLAYKLAETHFDHAAVNRIILATDGDFNVGIANPNELQGFVERQRDKGIFLSVLGFGQGNYNDALMQQLAQNGNGIAAYIDTLNEAEKVLLNEAASTLFPIAKDVKLQVEFNSNTVAEYRLIGYESRQLNEADFNNDAVDGGDIGSGHTLTALYEITPIGSASGLMDQSRYHNNDKSSAMDTDQWLQQEYAHLKIRYKLPGQTQSRLLSQVISQQHDVFNNPKQFPDRLIQEIRFATAVAGFAQLLKGGQYTDEFDYDDVLQLAMRNRGEDSYGYRAEFIGLVKKAKLAEPMRSG